MKRLTLPASAFCLLVVTASATATPAHASAHCNEKVCAGFWWPTCQVATGGPGSHCLDGGGTCHWDACSPQ